MLINELPHINLLPKYKRQSPLMMIIFGILSLIIIGLLIFFIFDYFSGKNKIEDLNQEINLKENEINHLKAMQGQGSGEGTTVTLPEAISIAEYFVVPTSMFIDDLIIRLPKHAYLTEYDYDNGEINVVNQFETLNFVASYVDEMLKSSYLIDVKTDKVEEFDIADKIDEKDIKNYYNTIPRYQATQTLRVDRDILKEEEGTRE